MEELTIQEMEQAQNEILDGGVNFDASGKDMIVGGAVSGGILGIVLYKVGYAAGIKDAAKAYGKDPKKALELIKSLRGEKKGGIFGWKFRSPVYKDEPKVQETESDKNNNVEKEEEKSKPKTKRTRKSK